MSSIAHLPVQCIVVSKDGFVRDASDTVVVNMGMTREKVLSLRKDDILQPGPDNFFLFKEKLTCVKINVCDDVEYIVFQDLSELHSGDIICSSSGKIVHVTTLWERITGYAKQDVIGSSLSFLQGPLTSKDIVADMNRKTKSKLEGTFRLVNYRKCNDSTLVPFVNNIETSFRTYGAHEFFIGAICDCTPRKETNALCMVDMKTHNISFFNPGDVFDWSSDDVIGEHVSTLIPASFHSQHDKKMNAYEATVGTAGMMSTRYVDIQ